MKATIEIMDEVDHYNMMLQINMRFAGILRLFSDLTVWTWHGRHSC